MKAKDSFRIGVKYGVIKKMLRKIIKKNQRERRNIILKDLRFAGEELLDFLRVSNPKTLEDFLIKINDWLELEAKVVGGEFLKYEEGEGENLFKKVQLERAIFYKKNKEKALKSFDKSK